MRLLPLAARLTALVLLAFSARRAVLLAAAVWPRRARAAAAPAAPLGVHVCVPCRNEAAALPRLLAALDELDYPRSALHVSLIDDGSTDATPAVADAWAADRPWARLLRLPASAGKAQAINAALAGQARSAELVVIYDADHLPAPDSLERLAACFAEPRVGAASGQMRVSNGADSPAAFYAHIESLVNQFVSMRGKERLQLAPAVLGSNCAYRLAALEAVGGFRRGALLEDSDLTVALAQAGWQTRFVPEAVSDHQAPPTVRGYLRQHLRWNRGFHQVAGGRLATLWGRRGLSLPLKLELTFFALGYADRLALLAGAGLTLLARLRPRAVRFPAIVWPIYFGLPALEMLAALALAGEPRNMYPRLAYVPFFFGLDIAAAAWSSLQSAARRPARWTPTERATARTPHAATADGLPLH